ncbi:abc transporter [Vairimorpha apis BRL 01]|uniref:Abc transporter n=1 Tax=Vairimorpha apis BRL 01 TaxID=1037528 RepID=T0LB73_9MICR|nr:abc transporter [Vairimorpha apis BRL 01]
MQVSQYLTDIGDSRVVGCRLDEDDCCGEVICSDGGCDGGVYCNNVNNTVNNSCNTVNNKNVNNSIYNNNDNTPSNTILCNNIPSNIKSTINSFNNKLEFKNFSLKINNRYLIKNANLEIKKGEKVAIIGKNGTGKSSFVNVLLRLRDYEGKFLIDGQNVSTITKSSLRDIISYIPQNPGISEGTVLDNLTYGNPTIPFDKVKEYCFEYGVDRLFNSLQNGYNTQVGEMGKYLSGGQKQRISFMRAVIKNGDIFIFDEPTSNLDSNSEREVLSYVFSKLKYKTSVVILHNMEYLNKFDKILGFSECGIKCYEMYEEYVKDEYLY